MKWSDIPRSPSSRTLRQFAAAWLVFFLSGAAVQWFSRGHKPAGAALAALAIVGAAAGLFRPSLLRWVFVGWMMLAFPIGWLVSQLMLVVLFYGVFTPVAWCLRIRGRDALGLKPGSGKASFWLPKEPPLDLRRYFRQY